MKKYIYFILLCFSLALSTILTAQSNKITFYGQLKKNKLVPTFGDNINVRSRANLNSAIVAKLPAGIFVKIIENTKRPLLLNGYQENWYLIRFRWKGRFKSGYVWGALLSKSFLQSSDKKLLITMSFTGRKANGQKIAELRLVKDRKIISKLQFTPIEDSPSKIFSYSTQAQWKPSFKALSRKVRFFSFRFIYGACDYPNGEVIFILTASNQLLYGLTATESTGEAGSSQYSFIFPNQKGGKKSHLIIKHKIKTRDMESGKIKDISYNYKNYLWKNNRFIKQ